MAYEEDLLGAMVLWVEEGRAPEMVTAAAAMRDGKLRRRPIYAYPARAKYKGSGDIDDPASFAEFVPSQLANDRFEWVGPLTNG